jgi:hypothetical protein
VQGVREKAWRLSFNRQVNVAETLNAVPPVRLERTAVD